MTATDFLIKITNLERIPLHRTICAIFLWRFWYIHRWSAVVHWLTGSSHTCVRTDEIQIEFSRIRICAWFTHATCIRVHNHNNLPSMHEHAHNRNTREATHSKSIKKKIKNENNEKCRKQCKMHKIRNPSGSSSNNIIFFETLSEFRNNFIFVISAIESMLWLQNETFRCIHRSMQTVRKRSNGLGHRFDFI